MKLLRLRLLTNIMLVTTAYVKCQIHVSLKESTRQSGTYFNGYPDLAMDDDVETCSNAGHGLSSKQKAWWRVKLFHSYLISRVTLAWSSKKRRAYLKRNVNVYVSTNKSNFEQHLCATHRGRRSEDDGGTLNLTCQRPTHGRYVTVQSFGRVMPNNLVLCEVYIFTRGGLENVSLFAATKQNGLLKNNSRLAVDGDVDTCAKVIARKKAKASWTVKLNDTYDVTGVQIFYKVNSSDTLTLSTSNIYISNDPDDLEKKFCATFGNYESESRGFYFFVVYLTLNCPRTLSGDIITVKKSGGYKPRMLNLCEMKVLIRGVTEDCTNGSVRCIPKEMCIIEKRVCDGVNDCPDGSDEIECACQSYQHKCEEGLCIHRDYLCDGTKDCPLGDDETAESCLSCPESSSFKCFKNNKCIEKKNHCDGTANCPDSSDEQGCLKMNSTSENGFLRASFEGEPDYYICSARWKKEISLYACNHLGSNLFKRFRFTKVETEKILKLKNVTHFDRSMPFMSLFKKSRACNSKKFVELSCSDHPREGCGRRGLPDSRLGPYIRNGAVAIHGAWPWHAQLVKLGSSGCGASIIQRNMVLTSAHCVVDVMNLRDIHIKVGTVLHNDPQAKKYPVLKIIIHPDYKTAYPQTDLALLKLAKLIHYDKYVQPVCLPNKILPLNQIQGYRYCVSTGFGKLRGDGVTPRFLMQGRVDIVSGQDCVKNSASLIKTRLEVAYMFSNYTFCTGPIPSRHGINMCSGDSGGPLVCRDEHGKWTQIGLIKGGLIAKDGEKCTYSVIMSVAHFLDFINSNISY